MKAMFLVSVTPVALQYSTLALGRWLKYDLQVTLRCITSLAYRHQ